MTKPSSTDDLAVLEAMPGARRRPIDRYAMAHDASHFLLVPDIVLTPSSIDDVSHIFEVVRREGRALTFRSGGTSLSGQGISDSVLVDTRKHFRRVTVLEAGHKVRVEPGATVRITNAHLAGRGRRLGPDPASEIACTIGGVVANNSSGMACGTSQNTYSTLESMVVVLLSGTIIDTGHPDADDRLRRLEPELYAGLQELRSRLLERPESVAEIARQYSMKNTMGYGLNSFVDFELPVEILAHLVIGSEGTLAFVGEATFATVELLPHASTGLLIFGNLDDAMSALPSLVNAGLATIELMDARSLRVAQLHGECPADVAAVEIVDHAAFLVEFQARTVDELGEKVRRALPLMNSLPLARPSEQTMDISVRSALWHLRKGLYTAVASQRPSGTTALLEDIVVPITELLDTCRSLTGLLEKHGYEGSVIFGHAKDGNLHFMLNERFDDPPSLARYRRFTEDLVDLVLGHGGSLKAEHGTGRIMAPFVRRQFGDELYEVMQEVKRLFDPSMLLNPGVLLSDDQESYTHDLKAVPKVESEVDTCVECGYCEPSCPSRDITLTPRQRIVVRREMQVAADKGDRALVTELHDDYEFDGVQTCAVDGLCKTACPVGINTGDLVRRLRGQSRGWAEKNAWALASRNWDAASRAGGLAMTAAAKLPAVLPIGVTKLARSLLGAEALPLYDSRLPKGGSKRPAARAMTRGTEAVYFAACITTMFGPEQGTSGVRDAFMELCRRVGVELAIPPELNSMCCGTPWKSKGYQDGYDHMTAVVLPALVQASDNGRIPVVCDASSCTEGLEVMRSTVAHASSDFTSLQFLDAVKFTRTRILPSLELTSPVASLALHYTCSTHNLGVNPSMKAIADFLSEDVHAPVDWGCCAFAGDRGLLHPELTDSATQAEAAELASRDFDVYASANRTCELGMSRATGQPYRHLLEVLEQATR